jgi:hypothetical protein
MFSSDAVDSCFVDRAPYSYPELPVRHYLVACVNKQGGTQVVAIYSLEQMKKMHAQCRLNSVNSIEWKALKIPKALACELARNIYLKKMW